MATMRLVPSTYYLSSSSYLSIASANEMYTNTDSTSYATVTNSRNSTSSYYVYVRGFNFDDIPNDAVINSFTVKLKARQTGVSTSTSYKPYLANGTSAINGTCSVIETTVDVYTFSGLSDDWDTISGYGSNFGIRINCRRASKNTTSYMYIYGAEIEVTYTVPNPRTITSTLTGSGTINPSGAYNTYQGEEYTLTITPTNVSETVTVTNNGTDVSSHLVAHKNETTMNTVLGTYTLVSGSFNSGESYFEGLEGNGVNSSQTSSNYYSGGSSVIAVFTYSLGMTVPSDAVITRVWCEVNGHAESTSNSSEYMCVQLKSGSTELSEEINFKSIDTSNTTITLEADTLPTVSQLASMVLQCRLGYYGGAINGATCYVTYETGTTIDHYTYTYTVDENATIAVTIGSASGPTFYMKSNGAWVAVSKVYKKVNGAWVQQTDLTSLFNTSTNYIKAT